jgi:hypothetical protein
LAPRLLLVQRLGPHIELWPASPGRLFATTVPELSTHVARLRIVTRTVVICAAPLNSPTRDAPPNARLPPQGSKLFLLTGAAALVSLLLPFFFFLFGLWLEPAWAGSQRFWSARFSNLDSRPRCRFDQRSCLQGCPPALRPLLRIASSAKGRSATVLAIPSHRLSDLGSLIFQPLFFHSFERLPLAFSQRAIPPRPLDKKALSLSISV